MEWWMDEVVVVPELVEEVWTIEEVVSRAMVVRLVVPMVVVVWTPEVAVHEMHEDPLHGVGYLRHESHGPKR